MRVLFGDRNGDGVYDDPPQDIDALHIRSSGGGVTSWLLSTSATTALPGAPSLKDGDVFAFDGQGGISVVYSEAFFETVTLTSGVDIDAFAESPTGRIWFSFAEDEQTGSAALTNQNNGSSLLDEQTVFSFDPGDTEAVIAWSRPQVVQVFNAATGGGASTVVDITGVAPDPLHPGEVLLCCRSTSNNYRSRVVSTAGGGMAWVVAGQPVGPATFSLTSDPILDALALTVEPPHPVLRVAQLEGSSSGGGVGQCEVRDLTPGEVFQLVVSAPRFPGPYAWQSGGVGGFTTLFPDPLDPATWGSFSVPQWTMMADAHGVARYQWGWNGLIPGTHFLGQGLRMSTGAASSPAIVHVTP